MSTSSAGTKVRPDDAKTEDLSGQHIGASYILEEAIGSGATGTVWRARDVAGGRQVAVKLLREDLMREPQAVSRFVQERAILLMLRHPHIVRVHDLLTVGESLGLVMDLVEGGSLREYLRGRGTLAPAEAAVLLAEVAEALAASHRLGIVHRDLKPDNILLDYSDGRPSARLTDFGIARVLDAPGITTPQVLVGTPNYVAPEIIYGGKPTPAVDVYALGVVLYELLTGRPPYGGAAPYEILRRHVDSSPEPVDGMPDKAWQVIRACMDRRPKQRPSADAVAGTLRALAKRMAGAPPLPRLESPDGDGSSPRPSGFQPPRPRGATGSRRANQPRNRLYAIALSTGITIAAVALVAFAGDYIQPRGAGHPVRVPHSPPAATVATHAPGKPFVAPQPSAPTTTPVPHSGQPSAAAPRTTNASPPVVEISAGGPWQCGDNYNWDIGHPVIAKPCHALGARIRILGHMQAIPGVQADISMSLLDAATGASVAGPYTCPAQMFTDTGQEHTCGPFDVELPHTGRRYVVSEKWEYTGRGVLPTGSVRGIEFTW